MYSLKELILEEFHPRIHRIILAVDPDRLLLNTELLEVLAHQGYELIPFEDPIQFRYEYERRFRSKWDSGLGEDISIIISMNTSSLDDVPYDILCLGCQVQLSLGEFFPTLSYASIKYLELTYLDTLYEVQQTSPPGNLGVKDTLGYILKNVFGISPELVKEPIHLISQLLQRHFSGRQLPRDLDAYQIDLLRQSPVFKEWPLEQIIPNRKAFFGFIQERWSIFLDGLLEGKKLKITESSDIYNIKYQGPVYLPLGESEIRVYLDNCFSEGFLQPIEFERADEISLEWVKSGIIEDTEAAQKKRIIALLDRAETDIPTEDAPYQKWLVYASLWANCLGIIYSVDYEGQASNEVKVHEIRSEIDKSFTEWLSQHYERLVNLPPTSPTMLHHIPRYLARQIDRNGPNKVAFLILDGMSMDDWFIIKESLRQRDAELDISLSSVFAWIPTLTSVSRQAAFSGKAPVYFPESIQSTDKEGKLWSNFWEDQGFSKDSVYYQRGVTEGNIEPLLEAISIPHCRVVGLVIDQVDKIMHGMVMGKAGMHNQIRQWAKQGFLYNLILTLLEQQFRIYVSSDHGNVEAVGCGSPREGAMADVRAARVRIFPNHDLRSRVQSEFPGTIAWPNNWLPYDYFPLFAPHRSAFVKEGEQKVTHGGISLEEVIVPFVEISKEGYV